MRAGPQSGSADLPEARGPEAREPRAAELIPGFRAESDLERSITEDPSLLRGLAWGKPRSGHPEGSVGAHVADLLRTLDEGELTGQDKAALRVISIIHDAFKYRVREWLPRTGENHHAMRARRFAERFTSDERLLSIIELHDRPYSIWRRTRRTGRFDDDAFEDMLRRLPDPQLFLRFIELDGSTEGKNPGPIAWFRGELRSRGLVPGGPGLVPDERGAAADEPEAARGGGRAEQAERRGRNRER